jgi:Domain of unknown function (DUF4333)
MGAGALLLVLVLAAVVVGCGETVIDDVKTEDTIAQNVESSLGKKVRAVDCPSGVEVEVDAVFECTISIEGGREETAELKILNEDADIELIDLSAAK